MPSLKDADRSPKFRKKYPHLSDAQGAKHGLRLVAVGAVVEYRNRREIEMSQKAHREDMSERWPWHS